MADNDSKIVPFNEIPSSGVDLNLAVQQAHKMTEILDSMGIEKATFKSGAFFQRTENVATLSTDKIMVQQRQHSTSVTFRHEGSSDRQAIEELAGTGINQETLGAFSGKSQSWASRALDNGGPEEGK